MQRVLMIAYHFPPLAGSSGIQRTLRFVRHLPEFGWSPVVLSAHPRAYERCADDLAAEIPAGTPVIRAQAWDAARHFAIAGRYPGFAARPDRWISWWLGAVPAGLAAIRRHRPAAIWSTYPVATAHVVAATLARLTGLPWIADFRDPMAQEDYPTDPAQWRSFLRVERAAIARACFSTFTAPGAAESYRERYPQRAGRIVLLENGYDDEFPLPSAGGPLVPGRLTLLHSGIVYPSERDPTALFTALARLRRDAPQAFARLRLRFRAAGHEALLDELARIHDVAEAIEILPPIGYRDALAEMAAADALLVLQAANCNAQIPAKLYEYLAARRPLIALTDPAGDTAAAVRAAGIQAIAPLDDAGAIAALLARFVAAPDEGTLASEAALEGLTRRERTRRLAALLDAAVADPGPGASAGAAQ